MQVREFNLAASAGGLWKSPPLSSPFEMTTMNEGVYNSRLDEDEWRHLCLLLSGVGARQVSDIGPNRPESSPLDGPITRFCKAKRPRLHVQESMARAKCPPGCGRNLLAITLFSRPKKTI